MKKDNTVNERMKALRERKAKEGLVPVQVWVPPEHKQAIHDLAAKLRDQ